MKTIHDADFRHALIERFLDCDTTVEEEHALACFYSECKSNGCVPENESEICEIVLATIGIPQRQRHISWLRIVYIAAAAIAAVLVMTFFTTTDDQRATVASTTNVNKPDTDSVAKSNMMADASDIAPAPAIAPMANATQPLHDKASASAPSAKRNRVTSSRINKASTPSTDNIDMAEIYSAVSSLFNDVSNVLIERGSKGIFVSSVDENGEKHSFVVNGTCDGGLAITAI